MRYKKLISKFGNDFKIDQIWQFLTDFENLDEENLLNFAFFFFSNFFKNMAKITKLSFKVTRSQ